MAEARSAERPPAMIVDVDGTLCDVRSVRHFVEPGQQSGKRNFHAFHAASIDCPAHEQVAGLVRAAAAAGVAVLVVTAREARWGFLTALWLQEHDVSYAALEMRADGDSRPDADVKDEIATRLLRTWSPLAAVDDRDDILAVWRRHGIATVEVDDEGRIDRTPLPPALAERLRQAPRG